MEEKTEEGLAMKFMEKLRDSYIENVANKFDWKDVEMTSSHHKKYTILLYKKLFY